MTDLAQMSPERQILALLAGLGYDDTLPSGPDLEALSTSGATDLYAVISQIRRIIHGQSPQPGERWYDAIQRGLLELDAALTRVEGATFISTMADEALVEGEIVYTTNTNRFARASSSGYPDARVTGMISTGAAGAGFSAEAVSEGFVTRSDWSAITDDASVTLTPNARYYLSATPGKISKVGAAVGVLVQLGRATTTTTLNFHLTTTALRG